MHEVMNQQRQQSALNTLPDARVAPPSTDLSAQPLLPTESSPSLSADAAKARMAQTFRENASKPLFSSEVRMAVLWLHKFCMPFVFGRKLEAH